MGSVGVEVAAAAETELEKPDCDRGDTRDGHAVARRGEPGAGAGGNREACLGGARQGVGMARKAGMEQDGGAAPALGCQEQPPRRGEAVMPGAPELRQNRRSAEPQGLLDGPERGLAITGADQDQTVRIDPMRRQPRTIGRAGLRRRMILDDPDQGSVAGAAARHRQGETRRRGCIRHVRRHDLVQGAAP
jgi:hypothetical protein